MLVYSGSFGANQVQAVQIVQPEAVNVSRVEFDSANFLDQAERAVPDEPARHAEVVVDQFAVAVVNRDEKGWST